MTLPPLYKFLDVKGAKLTLENNTFKHSRPSDFNDIEDLTVQSIFPDETEIALEKLANGFTDVILQHLNDPPTCAWPLRGKVALIQYIYRTNPEAAEAVKSELAKGGGKSVYNVEYMRERANSFVKTINEYMQDYRIFCVTTHIDSDKMWIVYAEDNKGIALRIEPSISKDSKFQLFRPVEYYERRPSLYNNTLDFMTGSLFGDLPIRIKEIIEKIVYSKTLRWQHECEYRLAIPLRKGEPPWNTLKFHPEEVTELYLGTAMTNEDRCTIVRLAKALNPKIAIFQAARDQSAKLIFNPTSP